MRRRGPPASSAQRMTRRRPPFRFAGADVAGRGRAGASTPPSRATAGGRASSRAVAGWAAARSVVTVAFSAASGMLAFPLVVVRTAQDRLKVGLGLGEGAHQPLALGCRETGQRLLADLGAERLDARDPRQGFLGEVEVALPPVARVGPPLDQPDRLEPVDQPDQRDRLRCRAVGPRKPGSCPRCGRGRRASATAPGSARSRRRGRAAPAACAAAAPRRERESRASARSSPGDRKASRSLSYLIISKRIISARARPRELVFTHGGLAREAGVVTSRSRPDLFTRRRTVSQARRCPASLGGGALCLAVMGGPDARPDPP